MMGPARALYEEFRVNLEGDAAVGLREWIPFAAEVIGDSVHFYVKDLTTPQLTLAVWIDGEPAEAHGDNVGRLDFRRVAWFDFREGAQLSINLEPGTHTIVVRSTSDYSGTGFFARLRS